MTKSTLAEITFDDSSVDVQDEPRKSRRSSIDQDAKDDGATPTEDEAGHKDSESKAGNQADPTRARNASCSTACRPRIR